MERDNVLIGGGGIAGLTAALGLAQAGIRSVVLEKDSWNVESGAGIQLTPNATKVLFKLGLEKQLKASSCDAGPLYIRDWKTDSIRREIDLPGIVNKTCKFPYLQVLRSKLISLLTTTCRESVRIELRENHQIEAVRQAPGEVVVVGRGTEHRASVLLGADGVHSTIREEIGIPKNVRYSGWQAWRATISSSNFDSGISQSTSLWCGPNGHIVTYPINHQCLNCVFVTRSDQVVSGMWRNKYPRGTLSDYFSNWNNVVKSMIDQLDEELDSWGLFENLDHSARWFQGRVLLIGDAAHPILPHLAQGAALAIEDAFIVSQLFKLQNNPKKIFSDFAKLRRSRTAKIRSVSAHLGNLYHLSRPWNWIRELGTPWAIAQMVKSVYSYDATHVQLK